MLTRCTFPPAGTAVVCGLSGGADSTALVALAVAAGCQVSAIHVDHGLRDNSTDDARSAVATAERLGVELRVVRVTLADGANLEARARTARREAIGPDAMTGHTADDQAETVLLALVRGAGASGLAAIRPGWRHPLLALRRHETRALCDRLGLDVASDPTNDDPRFRRNRIRHEALPLLDAIAERDVTPLLARTADLLRRDDEYLEQLAATIDPTSVDELTAAPGVLATRALRGWLSTDGYPPDAAAIDRVLAVARGVAPACELTGGRRVERVGDRLTLWPGGSPTR